MEFDLDSSLFDLDQNIQYGHCINCCKKDQMIQKYVKLISLYKQKTKLNDSRIKTFTQSQSEWYKNRISNNYNQLLCFNQKSFHKQNQMAKTADTNFTWKIQNLELNSPKQQIAELSKEQEIEQELQFKILRDSYKQRIQKLQQSVSSLSIFVLHLKNTIYYLLESLDLKNNQKMNTVHFKSLINVLVNSLKFSQQQLNFIYKHEPKFKIKRSSRFNIFKFLL